MTPFKTVLVASAILAGGMLPAAAQTTASGSAGVSAATHCKDAQGKVQLKTAAATGTPGTPVTSGNTKGNGADTSMKAGTTGSGSTAADSKSGSMAGSTAAAANLAPCK